MDKVKSVSGYWIKPGQEVPEKHRFLPLLKSLNDTLGGQPEMLRVRLRSGKRIVVIESMDAAMQGRDYNFTICVVPMDRKTFIDILGDAIILGRDDEDNFTDIELTEDEMVELISWPYEK